MNRAIADQGRTIRLPIHVVNHVRKVIRARLPLAQRLNRDLLNGEIAEKSGCEVERVRELLELLEDTASPKAPAGDGDPICMGT